MTEHYFQDEIDHMVATVVGYEILGYDANGKQQHKLICSICRSPAYDRPDWKKYHHKNCKLVETVNWLQKFKSEGAIND